MSADILESLDRVARFCEIAGRERDGHTIRDAIDKLAEQDAEIVRLRGEVAERADDLTTAYMAGRFDGKAIAPAEAKGDAITCYDAGLLSDYGGGNVEWWWDYIRAELGRAHDFYASQITPQPADGEAVAEWQVWHKEDGWGATHPDNVAEYRARGVPVRPLYAHPPAPVQAAPQEGETKRLIGWRTDDYTMETDDRNVALNWSGNLRVLPIFEGDPNTRLAAHPSACELEADPLESFIDAMGAAHGYRPQAFATGVLVNSRDADRYEGWLLALQHRGDSRGVGRG